MWFDYPIKKTYIDIIKTPVGDLSIQYEQSNIREMLDFIDNKIDIEKWISNIFLKWKFKKNKFYNFKKQCYPYIYEQSEQIVDKIIKKKFKWLFDKGKKSGRIVIFSSIFQLVCEKYNLTPNELLDNYTWEQLEWMLDWIIFNLNEQTKEWQKINDRKVRKQKSDKSNEELLKKLKNGR